MSFLNPVNEPVLRFKSTDAGAPQINYNARVAGDIKEVLKACLVTGYGDKASAGWSIVNEVSHVAEFVSPSAAMSDYRMGINDGSTTSTDWHYFYNNTKTSPSNSTPTKSFSFINTTHINNGWQLLVTARGLIFIELVQHTSVDKLSARITYWGQCKSALNNNVGKNIMFFSIGHNGPANGNFQFFSSSSYTHINLSTYTSASIGTATGSALSNQTYVMAESNVDLVSAIYLTSGGLLIGELTPILSKIVNNAADVYGISDFMLDGRNVLSVCAGLASSSSSQSLPFARTFLVYLDYWGY